MRRQPAPTVQTDEQRRSLAPLAAAKKSGSTRITNPRDGAPSKKIKVQTLLELPPTPSTALLDKVHDAMMFILITAVAGLIFWTILSKPAALPGSAADKPGPAAAAIQFGRAGQ